MPAVCAADSGAFAQRWCAGLDSEIVVSLLKNSRAHARAHELTVARQGASRGSLVSFALDVPLA